MSIENVLVSRSLGLGLLALLDPSPMIVFKSSLFLLYATFRIQTWFLRIRLDFCYRFFSSFFIFGGTCGCSMVNKCTISLEEPWQNLQHDTRIFDHKWTEQLSLNSVTQSMWRATTVPGEDCSWQVAKHVHRHDKAHVGFTSIPLALYLLQNSDKAVDGVQHVRDITTQPALCHHDCAGENDPNDDGQAFAQTTHK